MFIKVGTTIKKLFVFSDFFFWLSLASLNERKQGKNM